MVLRKLDLLKEAVEVFVEAIHALPLHWGAWLELSNLVTNIEMVITFYVYMYTNLESSAPLVASTGRKAYCKKKSKTFFSHQVPPGKGHSAVNLFSDVPLYLTFLL